jgi:signal transduction histidine kinase
MSIEEEKNKINKLFDSSSNLIQYNLSSQLKNLINLFDDVSISFGLIDNYTNINYLHYNHIIKNVNDSILYPISYCPLILNNDRETYKKYISDIYNETLDILYVLPNRTIIISPTQPKYFPVTLTNLNKSKIGIDIYQLSTLRPFIDEVKITLKPNFAVLTQIIINDKVEYVFSVIYPILDINNQFKGVIAIALMISSFFEQLNIDSHNLDYYVVVNDQIIYPVNEALALENIENQELSSVYYETILNVNFKFIVNSNDRFKSGIENNEWNITLIVCIILLVFILALIGMMFYLNEKAKIKMKEKVKYSVYKIFNHIVSYFSHEIRNALNSIYTVLQINNESNDKILNKDQTEMIYESITRVKHFVDEMLSFQKMFDGKIHLSNQDFDVINFSKKIIYQNSLNCNSDIKLYLYVCQDVIKNPIIHSDSVRISQIILNGLSNAIKFTSSGYISLELFRTEINGNKYISFKLINSGSGLGDINPKMLFIPFNQGKYNFDDMELDKSIIFSYDSKYNNKLDVLYVFEKSNNSDLIEIDSRKGQIDPSSTFPKQKGSGMGLPISKMLSIAMGGDLNIYDEFKQGSYIHTAFHTVIMINDNNCEVIDISSYTNEYNNLKGIDDDAMIRVYSNKFNDMSDFDKNPIKILIVDDTADNLTTGKMLLSRLGYEVDVLTDGIFIDYKTINSYDIILLDIIMAHSSGFEVCNKLIHNKYTGIILATTGYITDIDINNYKTSGFNGVYAKPFQIKKTDAFIKKMLLTKKWDVLV